MYVNSRTNVLSALRADLERMSKLELLKCKWMNSLFTIVCNEDQWTAAREKQ
jgi:hypothetical protein